jgi:LmbE family N-acetylglucosaminyl deacetylase
MSEELRAPLSVVGQRQGLADTQLPKYRPAVTTRGSTPPDWGTVLGVWAHPDDEAYLSSGLMARAVRAGSRVVCVTATRGEGSSMDPERWPTKTLGAVREQELMRCLRHLGVNEHRFLDLPDVDWESPLPESGAERVLDVMHEVQPDTVLTFGPDGMTGHEGHKSVSNWTSDAFVAAAPPGAKLFHSVLSQTWADEFLSTFDSHGVYREGAQIPVIADDHVDLLIELDDVELAVKMTALQEHHSQLSGLVALFGENLLTQAMRGEYFRMAAPK